MEDTIVAISTALGVGAISIIRISGPAAVEIVNKIFKGKNLQFVPTHTINYGKILENNTIIDEVLVSVMRSPKTFTKEDVVEINCHGGIATTNHILEMLLNNGCRLAEPGEFTKRAFLNGRVDLIEAEGIMNLIEAKTEKARSLAINQIGGKTSSIIKELKEEVLDIMASIEVNIDYPEYEDIEEITINHIRFFVSEINKKLEEILASCRNSRLIKDGIKIAIIGRPNVGKSSILNALLDEERAIVTAHAGTTRDIVEGQITLDGFLLNIIDTAGIRSTDNEVEFIGVKKSLLLIENADIVLYILNNNEEITNEDIEIIKKLEDKNYVVVINKIDLPSKIDISKITSDTIYISALENKGFNNLKEKIKSILKLEKIESNDFTYLTNANSISLINECLRITKSLESAIENSIPLDLIEIDIRNIYDNLSKILGEAYDEDIINKIFENFCLGK